MVKRGLVMLCVVAAVAGRQCGQPAFDDDPMVQTRECSDRQCSRYYNGYCVRGLDVGANCTDKSECYTGLCTDGKCDDDGCDTDIMFAGCARSGNKSSLLGYVCAIIAVVFFGSNFVPVKTYDTGNGIFFQWVLCSAIMISGTVVQLFRGSPDFHPYAMVGGFLWCTGNIMSVTIIKCIGLSLGLCIWGACNMLTGWSSGKFGLFGVVKETVDNTGLNIAGVAIASVAVFAFASIEPSLEDKTKKAAVEGSEHSNDEEKDYLINTGDEPKVSFEEGLGTMRKPVGVALSVVSGVLYGLNFDPPTHMANHAGDLTLKGNTLYSGNSLDYVFSHFCGIYATSTFYMMLYAGLQLAKPQYRDTISYNALILPAFLSGLMWAIADISWFVANGNLGLMVSFPLVTTGPGLVSAIWGVFVFKEITGRKNLGKLLAAFFVLGVAVTMITLSKN
eukprot:TRINITY_DN37858_c0_g1_i1.p1 TRINITY_DN37858_c0_g1~~TRINITY_DN37858_c0_g1_i1.p1  ORF type:complete len:465 (+),score=136.35 TRINITY_DN37858_c0_g1_i1:56-1396(+)